MAKKHIVEFMGHAFAADSVTAATQAVAVLSKLRPARHITSGGYDDWHYIPEERAHHQNSVELKTNQDWREPKKPKKAKSLPAPKRGSILCLCEKSYVAPRESCPHCGRPFADSHNRTHGDQDSEPKLRLL